MKLSAYGRTVVARVIKTTDLPDGRKVREDVVLLSDRVVGRKTTWLKLDGKVDHGTGWERVGKLKEEVTTNSWLARKELQGYVTSP